MDMQPIYEFPGIRTRERAVCQLCGEEIMTVNGGRRTGLEFLSFETLLQRHAQERHPNVCELRENRESRVAA